MGGWLKRVFRRRPPLAMMCYYGAYQMFPRIALGMREEWVHWRTRADDPALMFYGMLLALHDADPKRSEVDAFRWHNGQLPDGRNYVVVQYPAPAPSTLTEADLRAMTEQMARGGPPPKPLVLAPYFSAWVGGEEPACYVLGQAAVRDRTTLRRATLAAHYSLGEGPRPVLADFVEVLATAHELEVSGATRIDPEQETDVDRRLGANLHRMSLAEALQRAKENED